MRAFLLITAVVVLGFSKKEKEKLQWVNFSELDSLYAKQPRPVLIDVYTNWCGWCKHMDNTTYKNSGVVAYINQKYYAVKFNAESKEPVTFKGKKFGYNSQYRVHELALYLTHSNLQFPHTVFLSDMNAPPAPLAGYLKPSEIETPLKFFGDSAYLTMQYPAFEKQVKKEWKDVAN